MRNDKKHKGNVPAIALLTGVAALAALLCLNGCTAKENKDVTEPVPFSMVKIDDSFWNPRLDAHSRATLSTCIVQIRDSTKRLSNFEKAAGDREGKHEGIYFDDSDVYKAMEGIAYSLINNPNPELEQLLEHWIDLVARSQQPDGYLNTYYTLSHPDKRWTDMEKHDMYCGGHMIEAAIAHYQATGRKSFLDVAVKFADYVDSVFGPGKRHWVTGHEEIELALVKLYHVTQEPRHLDLAHWLLEERGPGHGEGAIWTHPRLGPAYCPDAIPVSQITDITGHAVRAMYLFTGMADVAAAKEVPEYIDAMKRVWEDVIYRNMYITGGIGSTGSNEGFSEDYDLPNKTAYCETCASIGMVFWNNRMNLLMRDGKYADVLERSMYNGVLSGVSLEGDLFFYENPLESDGDHHRQEWYGCACCPSNVSRFIPSVGSYIYMKSESEVFVNLYIGSEAVFDVGRTKISMTQETHYPGDGRVLLKVGPERTKQFTLKMRIPGWCKGFVISVNGLAVADPGVTDGYLVLNRKWRHDDIVELILDMPVEVVASDPRVKANEGKRALQRGRVVYCLEQADNPAIDFGKVVLDPEVEFKPDKGSGKLNSIVILNGRSTAGEELVFIPYFAWDNRSPGNMKVWLDIE